MLRDLLWEDYGDAIFPYSRAHVCKGVYATVDLAPAYSVSAPRFQLGVRLVERTASIKSQTTFSCVDSAKAAAPQWLLDTAKSQISDWHRVIGESA